MPTTFQTELETLDCGTVLRLIGDADIHSAGDLERITNVLSAQRPKALVVDVARLEFISSLSIGLLLALAHTVLQSGGYMCLAAPSQRICELFQQARIDRKIPIVESVEAGLSEGAGAAAE